MQHVSEHVDQAFLQRPVPRMLSPMLVVDLFTSHLFERPSRTILHPVFITSVAAIIVMVALGAPTALLALPLGVIVGMLLLGGYRLWRRMWEDMCLLRKGLIIRAHIMKLRPNRTLGGEIDGALLDFAIAVAPRRTYIGSIWVADGNEALRLLRQGRVQVLCLPRTPATWRVLETIRSEVRYDHVGPSVTIPQDV